MKKVLSAVSIVVLVLGLGVGVAAAPRFNVTVMPMSTVGFGVLGFDNPFASMSTEFGVPVGDRLELVTGVDYLGWDDEFGRDSVSTLNLGARYFLGDDDQVKPFVFGNYGAVVFDGDLAGGNGDSLIRVGIGAVAPINDRWGVVAQTGLTSYTERDGIDETTTATFSSAGLRFSF